MFAVNPIHKDNLESGLINIFFGKSHSDIRIISAYDEKSATDKMRSTYPATTIITYLLSGSMLFSDLIEFARVLYPRDPVWKTLPPKPEEPFHVPAKDKFIWGLMFAADKYIKNKADKTEFKRILSTISTPSPRRSGKKAKSVL